MEVAKQNSRGGFLQLFDWNLKSKKKLFSNKPEHSEISKQGKGNDQGSATSRIQQVHGNKRGFEDQIESDLYYHYASSNNSDEGVKKKAPGVVARLMGLDSLPTSNDNLSFESQSFRDSYYFNEKTEASNDHDIVIYESVRNKLDGSYGMVKNPLELRLQKAQKPIERFQSEVLPPKSARPISITHNKLLSPIKSPAMIPSKNAAYIMEAAAKIIDQSPRSTRSTRSTENGKLSSSSSSSSVPLRIHDLKEKMAAAQKSSRDNEMSNKHMKRQPSQTGNTHLFKASEPLKVAKNKEKLVSSSVQGKINTQKRDMGKRVLNQKERNEIKPVHVNKTQINTRKITQKGTSSDALRQNNQKQNGVSHKNKESVKPLNSNQKDKKVITRSEIPKTNKVVNKIVVGSGKTVHSRKDSSDKFSIKKRPVSVNAVSKEESINWDPLGRKNGVDVVSFTFTSPIKKTLNESNSTTQDMEKKKNKNLSVINMINSPGDMESSTKDSSGFNLVNSDALSVLLEQKLKEFTSKVEDKTEDDPISIRNAMNISYVNSNSRSSSIDDLSPQTTQNWKRLEEFEEHNNGFNLERSLSEASCNSLESSRSYNSEVSDSKWCTSNESDEVSEQSCSIKELDDSASSSITSMRRKNIITILPSNNVEWELEYIRNIISNADLMVEEYALGKVNRILDVELFEELESHISETNRNLEEPFKVARKALFDCVEECLEKRCEEVFGRGFKGWEKWKVVFEREDCLAEDLYREILSWTNMVDLMVDEVVDKDMSTLNGKWVEFESDVFEEGIEVEELILSSLLDELVDDLLSF